MGACETSTVALGSECAAFATECAQSPNEGAAEPAPEPREPPSDAGQDVDLPTIPLDAGAPDSEPEDAAATPWLFALQNGSFEVTADDPDDLGDLDPPADTEIAPWEWCAGDVEVHTRVDDREPTEGRTLLRLDHFLLSPALGQALDTPLEPGKPYSLAFDADRSRAGSSALHVELLGGYAACAGVELLAVSEVLVASEDEVLQPYCVSFFATERFTHLVLAVDPLALTGRVYLDHLRAVESCP